jgi:hypothetical protein
MRPKIRRPPAPNAHGKECDGHQKEHESKAEQLVTQWLEAGPGLGDLGAVPGHPVEEHELTAAAQPLKQHGKRQDEHEDEHPETNDQRQVI